MKCVRGYLIAVADSYVRYCFLPHQFVCGIAADVHNGHNIFNIINQSFHADLLIKYPSAYRRSGVCSQIPPRRICRRTVKSMLHYACVVVFAARSPDRVGKQRREYPGRQLAPPHWNLTTPASARAVPMACGGVPPLMLWLDRSIIIACMDHGLTGEPPPAFGMGVCRYAP